MRPNALFVMLAAAALSSGFICSGGDEPIPEGMGGAPGSGGAPGTGGAPGAAMLPDPCTLLTPEEWAPLMAMTPVVEPRTGAAGPVTLNRCDWTSRGTGTTRQQNSTMTVAIAGAYGGASSVPMSMPLAIGDEGRITEILIARTVDIIWKKGALSATFKFSALVLPAGKTWPELRDAAIALARLAASRMP